MEKQNAPISVGVIMAPGKHSHSLLTSIYNNLRCPSADLGLDFLDTDQVFRCPGNTGPVLLFTAKYHEANKNLSLSFKIKDDFSIHCQAFVTTFTELSDSSFSSDDYLETMENIKKISRYIICSGIQESNLLEKSTKINPLLVLIEKNGSKVIYRSRDCRRFIVKEKDSPDNKLCSACNELSEKIFVKETSANVKDASEKKNLEESKTKSDVESAILKSKKVKTQFPEEKESCHICGKLFRRGGVMYGHLKTHEDGEFVCNVCGAKFAVKSNLKRHLKSHDPDSKKFVCEICDEKFTRPYLLKEHQEFTHNKNLPFQCNDCGKYLRSKVLLKIHIRSVHKKVKPFPCEVCGFKSSRVDNLNIHRAKVHKIKNKISRSQLKQLVIDGGHPFCSDSSEIPDF